MVSITIIVIELSGLQLGQGSGFICDELPSSAQGCMCKTCCLRLVPMFPKPQTLNWLAVKELNEVIIKGIYIYRV